MPVSLKKIRVIVFSLAPTVCANWLSAGGNISILRYLKRLSWGIVSSVGSDVALCNSSMKTASKLASRPPIQSLSKGVIAIRSSNSLRSGEIDNTITSLPISRAYCSLK